MPIIQAGAVNNTALIVPDLYVEIVTASKFDLEWCTYQYNWSGRRINMGSGRMPR